MARYEDQDRFKLKFGNSDTEGSSHQGNHRSSDGGRNSASKSTTQYGNNLNQGGAEGIMVAPLTLIAKHYLSSYRASVYSHPRQLTDIEDDTWYPLSLNHDINDTPPSVWMVSICNRPYMSGLPMFIKNYQHNYMQTDIIPKLKTLGPVQNKVFPVDILACA